MVGDGLSGEAVALGGDVAQRLLECYPAFMEAQPSRLRQAFPALSLASCQDVAQEAYLRVGLKAADGDLAPETNVMAYLRQAARNLAIDRCRREQQRGKRLVLMGGDALDAVPEPQVLADEDRVVLQELVIPAIEEMPESRRRQVVDLQSRGLSDEEIAAALDIPVHRLHNLRNKAVAHLRRNLAGHIRDGHRKKTQHGKKDR
ncbi:RNA polymerase sigma factor [Streptomyces inhibens]|uniref:RNA polymerase sigma factor n=1 Tax=Streptomyces inhibens TaxID=2293571 RepID=A0A371PQ65_STRIH|nr:RNA polymerase sigma factor [Streptomyces inhibens]REK84647.1 RNA polymerase sigma factor [Streptomyces inhibens]